MSTCKATSHLLACLLFAAPVLVGTTGCGAEDPGATDSAMTEQEPTAVVIDESGDGQTFDVVEGQQVVVRLPGNPSTGYQWTVTSTDRTFGYPVEDGYVPDGGGVGSGGVFEFVWNTAGALPMTGAHTVELSYGRSWEAEPIDTFRFTVNIIAEGEPVVEDVVIDGEGDGQTFDVIEGGDVVVQLEGNPTTGYEWTVASTDRTFGYPASEQYLPSGGPTGSGGIYEFIWRTDGALSMVGTHTVVLQYARSWEAEPIDEFTFTVNVQSAE